LKKVEVLEEMKPTLELSKRDEAREIFEDFIYAALTKVDKEEKDNPSESDESTAKNFMTVALLIDAMDNFEPLNKEWKDRRKYCICKGKATIDLT